SKTNEYLELILKNQQRIIENQEKTQTGQDRICSIATHTFAEVAKKTLNNHSPQHASTPPTQPPDTELQQAQPEIRFSLLILARRPEVYPAATIIDRLKEMNADPYKEEVLHVRDSLAT